MPRYIEKIRVPVRLARLGAPPEPGTLALAPYAELHTGPETLLERLNTPTQVVPFQLPDSDVVLLVMRPHIEWVDADEAVEPRLVRPATYRATSQELVRVHMAGGESFEGVLAIEMPDETNRASDYLNGDDLFFPLRMPGGTRLVNKLRVVDVLVHGAAAQTRAA
jgi:hypothetical protein